jgi:hypothetical protein
VNDATNQQENSMETTTERRARCTKAAILKIAEMTAKYSKGANKKAAEAHLVALKSGQ